MTIANRHTQCYGGAQSLLFNNPHRVIQYRIRDNEGCWQDRASIPAPVRRLFETEAPPERTCLRTIQFVHHMLIPPGGRHVAELHVHPDAEEIVVVTSGNGEATVDGKTFPARTEDVIYIPPDSEHEIRNTGADPMGVLFINVPTGDGLQRLRDAQTREPRRGG